MRSPSALGFILDAWSMRAIAPALAVLRARSFARRSDPVLTALAAVGLVLMLFKVGALQYPILLSLSAAWFAAKKEDRVLRWAASLYAGWSSVFSIAATLLFAGWPPRAFELARRAFPGGTPPQSLKVMAAVPACVFTLALIMALLRRAIRREAA